MHEDRQQHDEGAGGARTGDARLYADGEMPAAAVPPMIAIGSEPRSFFVQRGPLLFDLLMIDALAVLNPAVFFLQRGTLLVAPSQLSLLMPNLRELMSDQFFIGYHLVQRFLQLFTLLPQGELA